MTMTPSQQPAVSSRIPIAVKVGFTAFMAVLVPYYWMEYGPTNFVYFCDVALFLALAAVWTEKPLWASMAAVGITLPQLLWQVDFLSQLVGVPGTGMTSYMFDEGISLFARGLSFFHFWLPLLLLYLLWRLGYDRRAFWLWTATAWGLMIVAYAMLPAPGDALAFPNQPHNVNYVFGPDGDTAQGWMPPLAWLGGMLCGLPTIIYLPTHWMLSKWIGGRQSCSVAKF